LRALTPAARRACPNHGGSSLERGKPKKWLATRPAGGVSRSTIPEDPIHRGDVLFGHTAFSEGATRRARSVTPSGGPELSGPSSVRDVDVTNPDFTRRTRGGASRPGTDAASVRVTQPASRFASRASTYSRTATDAAAFSKVRGARAPLMDRGRPLGGLWKETAVLMRIYPEFWSKLLLKASLQRWKGDFVGQEEGPGRDPCLASSSRCVRFSK